MTRLGTVRPLEAALVTVGLAGFTYIAGQWALEGVIHSRKTQTVPDLKGRSLSAALDMIAPLNLGLKKDGSEFDNSVAVAAVLRQNPPAGTVVREGKIVRVVVSQGGETVFTPSISALPLRNAEMLLRQGQLALGEVSETYSLRMEKGMVLSQDPKAESSVERNSLVNVVVSGGPPPAGVLLMPDFLRKKEEDASSWADGSGIKLSVTKDSSSLFPRGVILSQTPTPDSVVTPDNAVSIVVSARAAGAQAGGTEKTFHYEVSQGGSESLIRIVVADKDGERELFNGLRRPGSKIDLPIPDGGSSHIKIFVNGILVEEKDL